MKSNLFITSLVFLIFTTNLWATVFYVDPSHGSMANNGSISSPWSTLFEVIEANLIESYQFATHPPETYTELIIKNEGAPVKAGDTIMLLSGYHGEIELVEFFNSSCITIMAAPGHTPQLARLRVVGGCKWIFSGLTLSPDFTEHNSSVNIVQLESHNWRGKVSQCTVENCTLYSVFDASNWTREQWDTLSSNGINTSGEDIIIHNNYLKNVNFGISVTGINATISNNVIENFAGDGMRGIGNDLLFEYNVVKNCYDVNENHDDGFQSWSINDQPPRERVTLRGNIIINYEDENQPFRGTLQGIGCFDGPYINWVVENNIVITDHWHGISLYGAVNSRIVNNTVIDPNEERPGPPWIGFFNHKDGTPSENCIVRNNIATNYQYGKGSYVDHNLEIEFSDYDIYFTNWQNNNLELVEGCNAIDAGFPQLAPINDAAGRIRPFGDGIDLGAYEFGSYVADTGKIKPNDIGLINYPNPFSSETEIVYTLNKTSYITLNIYDISGKLVAQPVRSMHSSGKYTLNFRPRDYKLPDGIFICKLTSTYGNATVDLVHIE